jgi:hypothetical protein
VFVLVLLAVYKAYNKFSMQLSIFNELFVYDPKAVLSMNDSKS